MPAQRQDRACIECRQKKIKCNPGPSSDEKSRCHRCSRMNLRCEFAMKKQRTKKRLLNSRVDQLERVCNQILPLLSQYPQLEAKVLPALENNNIQPRTAPVIVQDRDMSEVSTDLESGLCIYRKMSSEYYPYVIVPADMSAATLREKRPMLALAIPVVTNWKSPSQQAQHRARFLKELSIRYFINDERSLDLLQALIVYFGWCQWYVGGDLVQAYRFASLVITVATELGINEPSSEATQHAQIMYTGTTKRVNCQPMVEGYLNLEIMRAYLAAYELSAYSSTIFRKPSPLAYTKYLQQCMEYLKTHPQYPTDATLPHCIEPLHLTEVVMESFNHGSAEAMQQMNEGKLKYLLKAFSAEFNEWEAALPDRARSETRLMRKIHMARVYMNEASLYEIVPGRCPSAAREEIVLQCFNSSKSYLVSVLALPHTSLVECSYFDWKCLNYAVMINCRAATILDSLCHRSDSNERAEWLDFFTNALSERITAFNASGQYEHLEHMINNWSRAKSYYHQAVREMHEENTINNTPGMSVASSDMPTLVDSQFDLSMYNMTWSTFGMGAPIPIGNGSNVYSYDGWS